jgi:sigma-B regulation protein RsbU (phosphoserine phosphatase)
MRQLINKLIHLLRIQQRQRNPWLQRPRRERLGFAIAAFCLFAPIGLLNQLLRLPATPRPFGFALLALLLSGAFAAYMVLIFDRALFVIIGAVVFFLSILALANWESSFREQQTLQLGSLQSSLEQTSDRETVQQYREKMQPALVRDMMITILMIVLGYIFFVRAFSREMEKRTAMESELKVARKIQESLLPPSERKANGWQLYGAVQSASEVAGDYFDYIELSNNRLGVLVADASGHGVAAGLMMTMIKSLMLNIATAEKDSIATFSALNRSVRRLAPKHTFVTAAHVILPAHGSRLIEVTTFGHPPLLRYQAVAKQVEEIRTPATALGLQETLPVQPVQCTLQSGDLLLLYTDGLIEQINGKNQEWGLENLKTVFTQNAHLDLPLLHERILAAGAAHRGAQPQHDDITLVVIKSDPEIV